MIITTKTIQNNRILQKFHNNISEDHKNATSFKNNSHTTNSTEYLIIIWFRQSPIQNVCLFIVYGEDSLADEYSIIELLAFMIHAANATNLNTIHIRYEQMLFFYKQPKPVWYFFMFMCVCVEYACMIWANVAIVIGDFKLIYINKCKILSIPNKQIKKIKLRTFHYRSSFIWEE